MPGMIETPAAAPPTGMTVVVVTGTIEQPAEVVVVAGVGGTPAAAEVVAAGMSGTPSAVMVAVARNDWVIGGGGGGGRNGVAASVPVNVPDWSKILKEEYRENRRRDSDDDEDDDVSGGDDDRIPPHEYVARQMARARIASFSVHEGVGRTLKGRDLSRVRNAIWEKTGFQD
ncbi:hypothetical protein Leryth_011322 [Lithospermum erythrorhizon]|nr:hypothetical protein Leryth_011322 [Lithospermum erythrorhizon]